MKRLFAIILTLAMLLAVPMSAQALDGLKPGEGTGDGGSTDIEDLMSWDNPFNDVKETDWFYAEVAAAVRTGLFSGTSDNTFEPGTPFSRSMMVTVLYRMFGEPKLEVAMSLPFEDVSMSAWYGNAVAWAAFNGIVNGTSATTFSPDAKITRQDMLVILYRATDLGDFTIDTDKVLAPFTDKDKIAGYAKDAMAFGIALGIIKGAGENILNPQGKASRAEGAAILLRYENAMDWTPAE